MVPKILGSLGLGKQATAVARAAPFSKGRRGRFRGSTREEGEEVEHLTPICRLGTAVKVVDVDNPGKAGVTLSFATILKPGLFGK